MQIQMPEKFDIPAAGPNSPLAAALMKVQIPARKSSSPPKTPWRQNFEHSLLESIRTMGNRSAIGTRLDAIERIARPNDEYILSHLCSVLESRIAPLGEDGAVAFLDAVWFFSPRARMELGEPEQVGNSIMAAADKLGKIAENVSNARVFSLICAGAERQRDFKVLSKYVNYMLALTGQLKSGRNPEGAVKSLEMVAFQATFIADRTAPDGSNAKYVDDLLTKLLMKLNDLVMPAEGPESP